jgi:hypothetical protein
MNSAIVAEFFIPLGLALSDGRPFGWLYDSETASESSMAAERRGAELESEAQHGLAS